MTGKDKCKILKEIRRQIADDNDIELVVEECRYQGKCKGTCPKCEAELRYLENELAKRKRQGKTIAITAAAAFLIGYAAGEVDLVDEIIDYPRQVIKEILQPTGLVSSDEVVDNIQDIVAWD